MKRAKAIPFIVDRNSPICLARQVAEGCRNAIATGVFKVGAALPSLNELAESLGVSVKVVRRAYERLSKDGWLLPRNGVGYFAKDSAAPVWRGTALIIYDNNSYAMRTHADSLARGFEDGGYIVDSIKLSKERENGAHDLSRLRMRMYKEYDFAFTYVMDPKVVASLRELGCPVFSSSKNTMRSAFLRNILADETDAYGELISACHDSGVKSIELVDIHEINRNVDKLLKDAGFRIVKTITPFNHREEAFFSSIKEHAFKLFMRRFASPQRNLPDLFLFLDDFVLTGALPAFSNRGIRVPEDVRVAVLCSHGDEPCWEKSLTRLVFDQGESGRRMAEEILCGLLGGTMKRSVGGVLHFVRGDTL